MRRLFTVLIDSLWQTSRAECPNVHQKWPADPMTSSCGKCDGNVTYSTSTTTRIQIMNISVSADRTEDVDELWKERQWDRVREASFLIVLLSLNDELTDCHSRWSELQQVQRNCGMPDLIYRDVRISWLETDTKLCTLIWDLEKASSAEEF